MLDELGYKHTLQICNTYFFPRQNWLRECASILPYTYIACLIISQALPAFRFTCYSVCGTGCVRVWRRFIKLLHSSLRLIRKSISVGCWKDSKVLSRNLNVKDQRKTEIFCNITKRSVEVFGEKQLLHS